MTRYRLRPDGFRAVRRRIITRLVPLYIAAMTAGILYGGAKLDAMTLGITALVALGAMAFGLRKSLRQQRAVWEAFELHVGDEELVRQQPGLADMRIRRDDVARIRDLGANGLLVISSDPQRRIGVLPALDGYDEVARTLATWRAFDAAPLRRWEAWAPMGAGLATAATMAFFGLAKDRRAILGLGATLCIALGYSAWAIWRSPYLDRRTKRLSPMLILMVLAIVGRTVAAR